MLDGMVIALLLASMLLLARSPRLKIFVILINVAVTANYLLWRGLFTLNTVDRTGLAISITLLFAEIYGAAQNFLFHYQSYRPTNPKMPPQGEDFRPSVDIIVTIYDEPKEILIRTLVGCKAQDWPADMLNIYVSDDGRREEIKELAHELGCSYITRFTNEDSKAGNINNALKHSSGEVVAIFDCDHVPVRNFLKETVGHFLDQSVAIVQVPHHFYNPDTFQRNFRLEREIQNEQDLFFHVIQPGRDTSNSAFFAGSCGLFRRSALEETGGMITKTVTEDLHTSMELHSMGYKSVYVNKDLSAGLSPESVAGYLKQRSRWAQGGIQVFMLDNPLLKKGLGLKQRIQYLASVIFFFHGLPRIIFLAAPIAYLLFSYPPLVTDLYSLMRYFIPHYAATIIAFNMAGRGYRNPFWSDVYETLMSFGVTLAAARTVIWPFGHNFVVTPKGETNDRLKLATSAVLPHLMLLGLLIAGVAFGVRGLWGRTGILSASVISLSWATYNALIIMAAVIAALERPQRRKNLRLARSIPCKVLAGGNEVYATTRDISETGLSLSLSDPIDVNGPDAVVELRSSYGEVTRIKGQVVRNDFDKDGGINMGIHFVEMTPELQRAIIRQIFSPEDSWTGTHAKGQASRTLSFFNQVLSAPLRVFQHMNVLRRTSPRFDLEYDCELVFKDRVLSGRTKDLSNTGISVELPLEEPLKTEVPETVVLRVNSGNGRIISIRGEVEWMVEKNPKITLGIKFTFEDLGRLLWRELKAV